MKKRFKSKYDIWIVLVLVIPIMVIAWAVVHTFSLVLLICMVPSIFALWLVADCFFNSYYEIDGSMLRIKFGVLLDSKIDIMTIKSILPVRTFLSSPAWSIDRIEVKYGKFGSVVISPADNAGFIKECLMVNPSVETKIQQE